MKKLASPVMRKGQQQGSAHSRFLSQVGAHGAAEIFYSNSPLSNRRRQQDHPAGRAELETQPNSPLSGPELFLLFSVARRKRCKVLTSLLD